MSSLKLESRKKFKKDREPKIEDSVVEEVSKSPSPEATKKRKRDAKEVEELEVDVNLPEPLSKKELRKAKKAKQNAPSKSTKPAKIEDGSNDKKPAPAEEAARSSYGIWIGNLSFTTTKPLLVDFLTANSSITAEDITRVNMPVPFKAAATQTQLKPQNKGFAYVDFATEEALTAAMELTESMLGGRRVLIKNAKSFEGRPEKKEGVVAESGVGNKPATQKPVSKRVFVGNLSFDVTKEELSEHFNKAGKVVDLHMATFEDSGKCKGFAWVTFEETESAESAVRGWTRVPIDGKNAEESASEEDEEEEESDAGVAKNGGKSKKQKTRKWFINKLHGRPLRCEFAEDAQSRYKKRFGKDDKDGEGRKPRRQDNDERDEATDGAKRNFKKKSRGDADMAPGAPTDFAKRRGRTAPPSKDEAYKTGAITEAKGTKVTFD